jgi:sigma-54 dependent transcriptional regulator, acetoin dehydrogenase operon transcriptional activator AcoR
MSASVHDPARHARRILSAVSQGARDITSEVVAHSWARCVNVHRLDPHKPRRPPVLSHAELSAHHARVADVVDCARYEMTTLFQQLGDPESAIVLTDTDGVILHMVTSPEFERGVLPLGLRVGAVWSEAEAGTNGMGTCLAAASPVAVRLDEHFFAEYTSLTCSAVPVHDPSGQITAVLDVSSRSQMSQQYLLVLLGMTARMIENRLIDLRYPHAHPIHFHSRPEFVYTLHEGKLIVDSDSRVLAANHSALFQLGVNSVHEIRERRLDQIFQTTLDGILERSLRASYHPVVTYRANAAHRFFAVARLPAHDEAAGSRLRDAAARPQRIAASDQSVVMASAATPAAPTFADPQLCNLLETARRVVAFGTPLLLQGETGAGKEIFARAVHDGSPRARGPFVAINCASLPESLIEAELFGYRAGAFTGAERRGRLGKIVQANGGTLFLDEIGDMPLALQARLLRVLDERTVTPLGADEPQSVEFQLLSATHRQLASLVADGEFREDLFYRLAGIEMSLPALRDRLDRADLIRAVLAEEGGGDLQINPLAWDLLMQHPWPGNVRQLRHVLRTAVALADGATMAPEHLPSLQVVSAPTAGDGTPAAPSDEPALSPEQTHERQVLLNLLQKQRWNVSHVAKELAVSRNTLYRRMHRLHIPVTQSD